MQLPPEKGVRAGPALASSVSPPLGRTGAGPAMTRALESRAYSLYALSRVLSLFSSCRRAGAAAALVAVLLAAGASGAAARSGAIEPATRVNGMLVVQGLARESNVALFGLYCDPVVLRPGRRSRVCAVDVPPVRRIFVGHGIWAISERALESAWRAQNATMWIDGRRVGLERFGYGDRWLSNFAAADGRDVLLREWSIVLLGARGRHSIRYRTRLPQGVLDTTWTFVVRRV
jgi:hypothetical protein